MRGGSNWIEISHLGQYTETQIVSYLLVLTQHLAKKYHLRATHLALGVTRSPSEILFDFFCHWFCRWSFDILCLCHLHFVWLMPNNDQPAILCVILSQLRRLSTLELIQLIAALALELQYRHRAEQRGEDITPPPSTCDSEADLSD